MNVRALWHVRDASGEQNVGDRSELHGLAEEEEHDVVQAGRRLLFLVADSAAVGSKAESAQELVLSARIIVNRAAQRSALVRCRSLVIVQGGAGQCSAQHCCAEWALQGSGAVHVLRQSLRAARREQLRTPTHLEM